MTAKIIPFPVKDDSLKGVIEKLRDPNQKIVFWFHDCAKTGRKGMKIIRGFACRDCGAVAIGNHLGPYEKT